MLQAYINGIQYRAAQNYKISEKAGNKTSTEISVLVERQPFPLAGDTIQLKDGITGKAIFFGTCGIPQSPKYSSLNDPKLYGIVCGNGNSILDNRIANIAIQGATISEIVRRLFDRYIAAEGITLGHVSDIAVVLEVYTAANYNLRDTLNELANLVNAVWEITPEKVFNFRAWDEFPVFPAEINRSFLDIAQLQHTTKSYNLRTVQHISGATDVTDPQTEGFVYDGEQKAFVTVFPLNSKPRIWVNDTEVPEDRIGVQGFNSDDDSLIFLFSYESKNVNYVERSEFLTQGDRVVITYVGIFSIRVTVSNSDKISEVAERTGTSGIIERVQIANTVRTSADAVSMALSLLNQFEEKEGHLSFWMASDHLAAIGYALESTALMTMFRFNLPELGIEGEFVVNERTIEPIRPQQDGDSETFKISLKLVDRNILQSYGQTIRGMQADIAQLSIRPDEIVVSAEMMNERVSLEEHYAFGYGLQHYCCASSEEGSLFAPLDLGQTIYTT
ncbi:hypothetical protein LJC60_01130 [Ruminococcaceae bacterium OttesenSCG-928-D13]|nr:hypothetical protein [Ruminococcaceae bacterium OttesenSCG-928-D13]